MAWDRNKGTLYRRQANNPAAPAGLRQTSQRLERGQQQYDSGASRLRPWQPESSMLETAKSWYTGANSEGTKNGWDTPFYSKAFEQYDQFQQKAMQSGKASAFYGWLDPNINKQATGVATWGAAADDQEAKRTGAMRMGDVFNDGKKVANVYDDYDKATADVMMGEFLFTNDEKREAWKSPQLGPDGKPQMDTQKYAEMVEKARTENTERALGSKSAEAYEDRTQAREIALREGKGDEGVILGGAAGGAIWGGGIGFAAGTVLPGVGNVVGAAVGAVAGAIAGGVGAAMNQDQLVEIAARNQAKAEKANQQLGDEAMARGGMQLGEYSELGLKFLNPLSNLTEGTYDWLSKPGANVGDMTSEFYKVNPDGTKQTNKVWEGLHLAATLGDGIGTFASPVGAWTYTAATAGHMVGNVSELKTGMVFNDRTGEYDELNGWQEWTSAVASTAIDAVQLGAVGGMANAARSSRALFTGEGSAAKLGEAGGVAARQGRYSPQDVSALDKVWTKAQQGFDRKVLGKEATVGGTATSRETANGFRYVKNEQGQVLSSRVTLEALAPSEFLRWIPTGYRARRLARNDGGEMSRDHMLRAATTLTQNSQMRNALLMGYTEGGEEAVQAVLDPMATGNRATPGEVFSAFLYGAAGGIGMGLGANNRPASARQQMEYQAFYQHSRRQGGPPTAEEWAKMTKGWSKKDWQRMAATNEAENKETMEVYKTVADFQRQDEANHSSIGFAWAEQMKHSRSEELHKKALSEGNGSLVLKGQTSEFLTTSRGTVEKVKFAANAGVMTAYEAIHQVANIAKGHQAQLDKTNEELSKLGNAPDGHSQDLRAAMLERQQDLTAQVKVSNAVAEFMRDKYRAFADDQNPATQDRHIAGMNKALSDAYTGKWSGGGLPNDADTRNRIQRAVEVKLGRHPFQDRGSFAVVMPQISVELTKLNAHSEMYVVQGMLKALNGDHDGDTVVPLHNVYEDAASLRRLRLGEQYMQEVEDEVTKKRSVELVIDAPDGEWMFTKSFKEAMFDPKSQTATTAQGRLNDLITTLMEEYSTTGRGHIKKEKLEALLGQFKQAVLAGRADARKVLVTEMVNVDPAGFRNHQNPDGVANVQWIWHKISETWDILQKDLSYARSTEAPQVAISPNREARETTVRSTIARMNAATASGTLGLLASDSVRGTQHLHFSNLYRSLTEVEPGATMTTQQQLDLTERFMELGKGRTQREIDLVTNRNAVTERVYYWLQQMANSVTETSKTTPEVLLLLSNMSVPSVSMATGVNKYQVVEGQTTMLQLLLSRSLDIERARNVGADPESDEMKKIRNLERLTHRDPDRSKHSTTASLAMIEVMGDRPLFELIGTSSSYISPQITLNQMIEMQRGLHPRDRNAQIQMLIKSPGYIKDKGKTFGDPPWPVSVLTDKNPPINAMAMLVDAVKVAGDTYVARLKDRDATVQKNFILGLAGLKQEIDAHRAKHDVRLRKEGKTDKIEVLRDLLENNLDMATDIAKLIPDAAGLGVFQVHEDNRVTASKWLEQMLVMGDNQASYEKAAAVYYLHSKLAEWNQMGGTVNQKTLSRLEREAELKDDSLVNLEDVRGHVDPSQIKSRFLQVMYQLASQPTQIELSRFITAMHNAPSVDKMFEMINSESVWRNNQAELLPWHDDVADFQEDPSDSWKGQMDGALQRENIRGWGQRMQIRGDIAAEAEVNFAAQQETVQAMLAWRDSGIDKHGGRMYYGLLQKAIKNRQLFPDYQGQVARSQLSMLQITGIAAVQNKGVADPAAGPFGDPLVTMDSFGWSDPLRQELASLTSEDVDDVLTNLTLLADGPVDITFEDGSHYEFDISDVDKALDMLADPRTQGLALAILSPTVRDVNTSNVVQTYMDTDARSTVDSHGVLSTMLKEQTHKHLFDDPGEFGAQLKQAYRVIGLVEAYIRKQAVGSTDPATLDKSYMPIQKMIHEFITAQFHSRDVEPGNYQSTYDRLVIDIANAMKAVASVSPDTLGDLREHITAVMVDRFTKDSSKVDELHQGKFKKSMTELLLKKAQRKAAKKAEDEFKRRLAEAKTQDERNAIRAEQLEFARQRAKAGKPTRYPSRTYRDVAAALRMFELTGDPSADRTVKAEILAFLGAQDRIHKLERKTKFKINGVEVNGQSLYHSFMKEFNDNPTSPSYAPEEWAVLGSWAAELYLNDVTARSSSSVPATGALLGDDGAAISRYFDQSFSFLADTLFDPKVLEAMNVLSQDGAHYEQRDSFDVGNELLGENGLLSEKKIGTWTEVIVNENVKARMILKNSSVGASLAAAGNNPKVLADYIGGGRVTWEVPTADHFSTDVLTSTTPEDKVGKLLTSPLQHAKLENHFVRKVVIQNQDPANPLDPALTDVTNIVAAVNETSVEVARSGLRVLDLEKLNSHLDWMKSSSNIPIGDYTISIEYVDVNKKPHERKWANNIFFDGVGRETRGGSGLGAVASLFFGLNGLNKIEQQRPLDAATKAGAGYRPHKRSDITDRQIIEGGGKRVAEILAAKAAHMLDKDYPEGKLMRADLPSLFKLQKMRHVVMGTNARGQREYWWAEKFIELEEAGKDIPLTDYKLVRLSDRIAQTLWGASGVMGVHGTRGSLTPPTFNIEDLDIFPDLSNDRLEKLGFDRIGMTADLGNTRLAQVNLPPREVATYEKGVTYTSLHKKRLEEWEGQAQEINITRGTNRAKGEGKLDIGKINTEIPQLVVNMLNAEDQVTTAHRIGMPNQGVEDYGALAVSRRVAAQFTKHLKYENSMAWVYKHGANGDLYTGTLGRADIKNNFAGMRGMGATYGDIVVVDLDEISAANGIDNYADAADAAADVLEVLAKRGLGVTLVSSMHQFDLRSEVVERLTNGSIGYRAYAESGNFFVPITEDATFNAAQRALNSTQTETEQFATEHISLQIVSDGLSSNLTEGTQWVDVENDPAATSVSHTILPLRMKSTGTPGDRREFSFNEPQRGSGRADQLTKVNAQLTTLLEDPEGVKYLKKLFDAKDDKHPQYKVNPNGTVENGILPIDEALRRLKQTVDSGKWAIDHGETFQWGTIIPQVSGDGTVYLARVGFEPPDIDEIDAQLQVRWGDRNIKLFAATNRIDRNQSLPPPTVVDRTRDDKLGVSVLGTYTPSPLGKSTAEKLGLKAGQAPLPPGLHFPERMIRAPGAAGARVTKAIGSTSVVGKEAGEGTINNFGDAFMFAGINFEDDMIDFMFGENPSRTEEERNKLWNLAQRALKMWAASPAHTNTAAELSRMLDNKSAVVAMEARFNAIGKTVAPDSWVPVNLGWSETTKQTPLNRLGTIMLTSLAAEGVRLEHVISTQGLTTVATHKSPHPPLIRRMPRIFTDALSDKAHPELRQLLVGRVNRNMPKNPATGKYDYWFDPNLQFNIRMIQDTDGGPREEVVQGFLQMVIPISADENSLRVAYAGVDSSGEESKHIADTIAGATGGRLMTKAQKLDKNGKPVRGNIPDVLEEFYGKNKIERFKDPDASAAAFQHLMLRLRKDYSPWGHKSPMEEEHIDQAFAKVKQYSSYQGIRSPETGWTPDEEIDGDRLAMAFLAKLNITDEKMTAEVEYMVRQLFGIPGPSQNQKDYYEHLSFEHFQSGIKYMERNLANGLLPLQGGKAPLVHMFMLKAIFDAQKSVPRGSKWLPLANGNTNTKAYVNPDNWGDWVDAAMGQMRTSQEAFDSRFRTDLDGFYRTYQGSHPDYMEMNVSTDKQIAMKLLHPEPNGSMRQYVSVDPGLDAVLRDPIVLDSRYMTYDALVGKGKGVFTTDQAEEAAGSVVARRLKAMEAWQKSESLPKQKDLSMKEYAKMGASYRESERKTSNFWRNMLNMSVATRLFNPALYVSAMLEVPFRSGIEGVTNVFTGQLTGRRGKAVSGAAAHMEAGLARLGVQGITMQPRYSVEDIVRMDRLNKAMGESNKFLGNVYNELSYQTVVEGAHGKVGNALEWAASAAARATADPRWGMKTASLAKRYNDAVWEHVIMTGSVIDLDQYIWEMEHNPDWIKQEFPDAHQMGLNAVKQARGAKSTMVGNGIMRPIERWTQSESLFVNGAGHLLKIPFLFTRFNANMLTTMTGLDGLDQAMAMFFDGRRKRPQFIGKMMNRAKKTTGEELEPNYWDNQDVIESLDLSSKFIRGAVTQTGLMAAGMMASGLSLGGEDDEEKKRKRLATYLNTPYYHDPNKAANDFRWTDAVFLDNIPFLSQIYKNETGHSAVVPHWIMRQFLSPVLGMMRFFEGGDVREIVHGFRDAASVLPNSVARLWTDADLTTTLLMETAADDELIPEKQDKVRQTLMNIVFVYEKALIENAFINALYVGQDEFDRNPWAIAKTDKTGDIVREQGTGQPETTKALQAYQTGEGDATSNRVGYMTRDGMDALLHQYAEGNATAALMMSIIPWVQGHDTTYLRGNMVTKKQRVKVDESPQEQIEALIYSTYLGRGGQDLYTKEEIIGKIKRREEAAGRYWKQDAVEAEADAIYDKVHTNPLTIFDNGGKEIMTQDGKEGVFRSLRDGVIDLDSPTIQGFNMSQAERDVLAEKLTTELVQEGVDYGLSEQAASFRMRRIWYGDGTKPGAPGLREILYDKKIPDKPYAEYEQLNVTYVLGPDGKPWATPFSKSNVLQALGIPLPHTMPHPAPGTTYDQRGNVVDLIRGINTGLAGIIPRPVASDIKANDDAVKKAEAKKYEAGGKPWKKFPWRNFGRRRFGGFGGFGGGGGGGGGFGPNFTRMQGLPEGQSARVNDMQAINTSNPIIRRADVRRERITSERGRLKQWQ